MKVENLRVQVDVEVPVEAVGEKEAGPPLRSLPPAEPAGRHGVRDRGEEFL